MKQTSPGANNIALTITGNKLISYKLLNLKNSLQIIPVTSLTNTDKITYFILS